MKVTDTKQSNNNNSGSKRFHMYARIWSQYQEDADMEIHIFFRKHDTDTGT